MKVKITGKTESTITFNNLGIILRGKKDAIWEVTTPAQEKELKSLERASLIKVQYDYVDPKSVVDNSDSMKSEQDRASAAESLTQKNGSKVIVSTGDGIIETEMTNSVVNKYSDNIVSDQIKASLDAMKKIEDEEANELDNKEQDDFLGNADLDIVDQMNRKAVICSEGEIKTVEMTNSSINKNRDPFIDREPKRSRGRPKGSKNKKNQDIPQPTIIKPNNDSPFVDDPKAGNTDAFIEI